ncbi:pheromone processing endoprotease [Quaeritorhiza haematococci]|nr:pheromone processing endoprotease [Quaeritorhiza haematococci]
MFRAGIFRLWICLAVVSATTHARHIPSYATHSESFSRIPANDHANYEYFAVQLDGDDSSHSDLVHELAQSFDFELLGRVGELRDYFLFAKKRSGDDVDMGDDKVVGHARLRKRLLEWDSNLWHLFNPEQIHNDINITDVWKEGIYGNGSIVCFIDDGLDYEHPDLKGAFYPEGSYDFNDHVKYPKPRLDDDRHGTRCAGEVAAARNDVCGVGVAWGAKVSGVRVLSGDLTEADESAALNFDFHNNHIYSCSWGPADDGKAMEAPPKIVAEAFYNGVKNGRNGLGSIFVFATGNGGTQFDNCNFDGYTNSIYTITVGAIDKTNEHPRYSEECSAQLVVAYSSGSGNFIYTSDWPGQCTDRHGGTSAAAPLASGIFALVLSIRPELSWRDMQHLAVKSAVPINLEDRDWQEVAESRKYNHKFGFGKLDAYRIVQMAKTYNPVRPQTHIVTPMIIVGKEIPQIKPEGLSSIASISASDLAVGNLTRLEHITVTVTISHRFRGDVEVQLVSPHGYVSQLATARFNDNSRHGFRNWTFMTVKHWDEDPVGNWTLIVRDNNRPDMNGTLHYWWMTLWGESRYAPEKISKSTPTPVAISPTPTTTKYESQTESASQSTRSPTPTTPAVGQGQNQNKEEEKVDDGAEDLTELPTDSSSVMYGVVAFGFFLATIVAYYVRRRNAEKVANGEYEFQVLNDLEDEEAPVENVKGGQSVRMHPIRSAAIGPVEERTGAST